MISMQRSLSSPVAIHSSPPVSPTITQDSRSPTPSPENHVEISRPRRFRSRSPARSAGDAAHVPARRSEDLPRRSTIQPPPGSNPKPKLIIAQAPIPTPSPAPKDSSDSLGTDDSAPPSLPADQPGKLKLRRSLLVDASLYSNPPPSPEHDGTTLEELAHLVRLSKYTERKRANTRIRLQRSLVSTALSARLMRCGDMVHRNLVECFRGDDKKLFAALYNAVIDVRKSCDETRRFALLEPDMELLQSPGLASVESLETPTGSVTGASAAPNSIAPFLNDISASARETFLNFLTQIRTNPDYLATRLASLNSVEFSALTSFHQHLEPVESVLPYHSRPSGRGAPTGSSGSSLTGAQHSTPFTNASGNRQNAQERSAIERLLSFQRHDPLSALIYTCFANSAGPDSAEDQRRTFIWANACARLISSSATGCESVVSAVVNVWISMRDWAGKSNLEWYLMKILEDGAFLLDRAEDQHGTRFNLSDWSTKDAIAAEEFYSRAVDELFEIIDDEDSTGIPEGLIELGNEIIKRLDKKFVDSTRRWLVSKCLFTNWLLGVIIHPEAYGMMAEYHITEYGRQKILKAVAMHAQKLVLDLSYSKTPVSTPPQIKVHIENIYGRFKDSRTRRKPRLLPARSITSLRETAEVHPYLVISPADLATLVNALFPERRPQSAQSGSFRSGAPSISGFSAISQPASQRAAQSNFDTISVVSTSAESTISEATTSHEPLLDTQTGSPRRYSPPLQDQGQKRPSNYEEDGYRLRLAMHEMVQILGQETVYGSCHPCAERWAVFFISADGNTLSTQMTYDPDDDPEEEESSSAQETDDDETEDEQLELDKDYHQLRDSILKLVQEYEIPQTLESDGRKKQTFSNRASSLKKYRSKNKVITAEKTMGSRNPYRQRTQSIASSLAESPPKSAKEKESSESLDESAAPTSVLVAMLNAASSQSRAQSDFVSAHQYWRTLQQLNAVSSESLRQNNFATLLNIFSRGPRDSIRRSASACDEYDAWLVWLKQSQERAEGLIESMMRRLRALRDKMWYVTDVRNSAPYEDSRNVAVALKTMGMPRRWNSFQRMRNVMQRGPAASYIYRTESQVMDLLAAPEEQGGPNKLRDDQVDKTERWLEQYNVENFCRGEERIHRFCCEVESCVSKLIGDNIVDGPVLWSSELYLRDRRILESGRGARDRDQSSWDDSVSVISDPERRYGSMGRPPSVPRDLRTMSIQNLSQQSFDSGRFSFSRASTALSDILDGPDYFGASSPVHAIDSSTTFWSPFRHAVTVSPTSIPSRAHSPTTSVTNVSTSFAYPDRQQLPSQSQHSGGRPGTSASSNETVYQQRLSEEKVRFLAELRQTITSLLLSDLGNLVFARGSETDSWFESLGQECIERREEVQRRLRQATIKEKKRTSKLGLKQRVIEKKKSFGDLRSVGGSDTSETHSQNLSPEAAGSSHGNESSATSDTVSGRTAGRSPRKDPLPEFPFTKAYQRLLRMFCVHPNPYAKLNALSELEHLIIASLNSGSRRARLAWARSEFGSSEDQGSSFMGRAQPLDEAIDNVKERRSHTLSQAPAFFTSGHGANGRVSGGNGNVETRSIATVNPANTDAIANVLQQLFRDASLRPKTLFRDLQFIASFVPASVLDKTERGKAFWDAALAALGLKQEVCRTMVEVADDIVGKYTQPRNSGSPAPNKPSSGLGGGLGTNGANSGNRPQTSSSAGGSASTSNTQIAAEPHAASEIPTSSPSPPPAPLPLSMSSLADAARLWTITAKEGNPTAQRELALFYLSNPELVERTTLPLSRPREVFKQTVMEKYGGGGPSSGRHQHHGHAGGLGGSGQGPAVGLGLSLGVGAGGSSSSSNLVGGSGLGAAAGGSAAAGKESGGIVGGDVRSDPALMCIAIHWMEAATKGGDELARTFLGQHEIGAGLMG